MKPSAPEMTDDSFPKFLKFLIKELSMTEESLLLYNNIVEKWDKQQNRNLAKLFIEKLNDPNLPKGYTIDDFYDEVGIAKEDRTGFGTAAILKQVSEMEKWP